MAVLTVTTLEDSVNFNDGKTSLREAVFAAGIVPGPDEILFDSALFASGPQTLLLTDGEIAITDSLTVTGPGRSLLTIDASGSDPTPDVDNGDGSRAFSIGSGLWSSTVIDVAMRDLAIRGGDTKLSGGAICSFANLEITNCILSDNSATQGGAIASGTSSPQKLVLTGTTVADNVSAGLGGGVHWQGPFSIVASTFSRNRATHGGGAYLHATTSAGGAIENCLVEKNSASVGGGIHYMGRGLTMFDTVVTGNGGPTVSTRRMGGGLYHVGPATLSNCTFTENDSSLGGGVYSPFHAIAISASNISNNHASRGGAGVYTLGSVTVVDTQVKGNRAEQSGGGIIAGALTMRRSIVHGNSAGTTDAPRPSESFFSGGGVIASSLLLEDSTISGNFAADFGGGVYIGTSSPQSTIANSTLTDNTANRGGAIYYGSGESLWIQHSTIVGNHAVTNRGIPGQAGGVWSNSIRIRNSIVAMNDASGQYPDLRTLEGFVRFSLIGDNGGAEILPEAPVGAPDERGSIVGGPVHGAIDPLLGPLADNGGPILTYALLPGSPAVGAGSLDLPPGGPVGAPEFDQRGAPFTRISGERIDMGAVEFQAIDGALSADFNLDGRVDGADFVAWQRNLGRSAPVSIRHGDATADGDVDGQDLAVWKARAGGPARASSHPAAGPNAAVPARGDGADLPSRRGAVHIDLEPRGDVAPERAASREVDDRSLAEGASGGGARRLPEDAPAPWVLMRRRIAGQERGDKTERSRTPGDEFIAPSALLPELDAAFTQF